MGDDDDDYGRNYPNIHARNSDPDTSHEAVPDAATITRQCTQVLRVYRAYNRPMTDHDAYRLAGLIVALNGARQRCTDLRHLKMIRRTGDRGPTPSGKSGYLCEITDKGREYLEGLDMFV